jgi:hypothetical protein
MTKDEAFPKHDEYLPCELTPEECHARGDEIAKLVGDYERDAADKKESVAAWNHKLETISVREAKLAKEMREGIEYRLVGVSQERDELQKAIVIVRLDTGERVRSRPMTEDEKQLGMFPSEAKAEDA